MIVIAGYFLVAEDERDRVVDAHRDLVTRARAFDGCLDLAITGDSIDRRRVNNVEIWRDAEALDAWRAVADPPDTGVEPTGGDMNRYDATDGGPLF